MCIEAGADALGFNFYPPSPRHIEPLKARSIIESLPKNALTIGVFVNEETPQRLEEIASDAGISALQLHGDESPEYCLALSHWPVIKVLRVRAGFQPQSVLDYPAKMMMLDAFDPRLRGGTGQVIEWDLAREAGALVPRLFLAGGLTPDNVSAAIAYIKPYGVDACSAIESRPGVKDPSRVRRFISAAKGRKDGG